MRCGQARTRAVEKQRRKLDALCCATCALQVSEGSGRLLVVAGGEQSEWGKTMALVGEAGDEDTPLQEKLGDMASAIGKASGAWSSRTAIRCGLPCRQSVRGTSLACACKGCTSVSALSANRRASSPQVGLGVALGCFIALMIKWFVAHCK